MSQEMVLFNYGFKSLYRKVLLGCSTMLWLGSGSVHEADLLVPVLAFDIAKAENGAAVRLEYPGHKVVLIGNNIELESFHLVAKQLYSTGNQITVRGDLSVEVEEELNLANLSLDGKNVNINVR